MKLKLSVAIGLTFGLFGFGLSESMPLHSKHTYFPILLAPDCSQSVDFGNDTLICEAGTSIPLEAQVPFELLDLKWSSPSAVLADSNTISTTALINETTTIELYVLGIDGDNLIQNGDFSQGDNFFTSNYSYGNGGNFGLLSNPGRYAIATNPNDTHNQFASCNDVTDGTGEMMVVNGSEDPINVWCQQITVEPNTDYAFSAWLTSVTNDNPAELQFRINGTLIGSSFSASPTNCEWNQFYATWSSGNVTDATICISNQNTNSAGNDFALDDISFRPICESTKQITITVPELNAEWTNPGPICETSSIIELNELLSPQATTGGTWRLNNSVINELDPEGLGAGTYDLTYELNEGACNLERTQTLQIDAAPVVIWNLPDPLCAIDNDFPLNDLLSPGISTLGAWTINGMTTDVFSPSILGVGNFTVAYTLTEGVCETTLAQDILVSAPPVATFTIPLSWCTDAVAVDLNNFLDFGSTPGGVWSINNNTFPSLFDPAGLGAGTYTISYTAFSGNCETRSETEITIFPKVEAGTFSNIPKFCAGVDTTIQLFELLSNAEGGGNWSETSLLPSTGNAFEANTATFNTEGQAVGMYTFLYRITGQGPCSAGEVEINVEITDLPMADAGEDQNLDCALAEITIGGPQTSSGSEFLYLWITDDGNFTSSIDIPLTEVNQAGEYVLTVISEDARCSATDTVTVTSQTSEPLPFISTIDLSCSGVNDGSILIDSVQNGTAPYSYSIDGDFFQEEAIFSGLAEGNYEIFIRDLNGCESSTFVSIAPAAELSVVLIGKDDVEQTAITLGDSLRLEALTNVPKNRVDTIVWEPTIPNCDGCLFPMVKPSESTIYEVTITDITGCSVSTQLKIFVERPERIFVPNAFSPNNDGINDLLIVHAGADVNRIMTFQILDRWGNLVYKAQDFLPNDPSIAWDGTFRGQKSETGVFIYFAEVEMFDGEQILVKGEIALMN